MHNEQDLKNTPEYRSGMDTVPFSKLKSVGVSASSSPSRMPHQ